VPFESYEIHEAIGEINRPQYVNLVADWLASIPEVDARLRAQPRARVADLACRTAWASIAIARAYPGVTVDAIDEDVGSIDAAQANVAAAGLSGRVRPTVRDASEPQLTERYDLVTIFEALHDMNHPVDALRAARAMLAGGGSVLVADERVAERFSPPGDEIERLNYGWSVLHCLAVGMMDASSAGTGTVIRPDTVRAYAAEAGFARDQPIVRCPSRVTILAVAEENGDVLTSIVSQQSRSALDDLGIDLDRDHGASLAHENRQERRAIAGAGPDLEHVRPDRDVEKLQHRSHKLRPCALRVTGTVSLNDVVVVRHVLTAAATRSPLLTDRTVQRA
jgi:2-polyprenyl-3-methyl-5-hydroxy-6-metoxy-1,4-benzoquinol methylase